MRYALALFLLALTVALALYFPTLRSAWAYDDFEYINNTAQVLAGKAPLWSTLLAGHDEHFVPAYRILLLVYVKLFGLDVLPWRVMSVVAYALAATFVALVALRYSGSRRAGVVAAIVFVVPCGFSSMWIWFSSGAAVPLSFAALTGACALLAVERRALSPPTSHDGLRARRSTRYILAGALVVLALATWGVFAPMAFLPAIVDELERRREGAKGPLGAFTLFCAAAMLLVLLVPLRAINAQRDISIVHGTPRALFLAAVAPFKLLFPGINLGRFGALLGIAIAALALALLAALWRRGVPRLAVLALLTTLPALAYLFFVGVGRSHVSVANLYDADRYFFPLLVPLALLAAAVAASVSWRPRIAVACALVAIAACEIAMHRRAFLRRIPPNVYETHARRFAMLGRLVERLERAGNLAIPDNILWFEDVHSDIEAPVFTHILSNGKRLRLGGPINEPRLNAELDAWAREEGEPVPFLRVVHGHLVNLRFTTTVDFSIAPFDDQVRGFHEWQKPYRWMSQRGELHLMLAPADLTIRMAAPAPARVDVTLIDEAWGGYTAHLGTIEIAREGVQTYRIPMNHVMRRVGLGRRVRIVLETPRDRSIQLYAFGTDFLGETGATVKNWLPRLN